MKRYMRNILIALLLVLLGASGCTISAQEGEYIVRNVIDGDTVELANRKMVRYLSIDAPETRKRVRGRWEYQPEAFAVEAQEANRQLIGPGRVKLEFDVERQDKYNRWLAYVYADDKMVNEELLRAGYAITYFIPPNNKHMEELVTAQEEAMRMKRGLWRGVKTIPPYEAEEYVGSVVKVKGRVERIFRTKAAIFLNFDTARGEFIAVIFSGNVNFFEKQGIFPTRHYEAKTVEITGKITYHDGPQIVVGHPFQIKIVD